MSIVSTLEVLINGNDAGLRSALSNADRSLSGFVSRAGVGLQTLGASVSRTGASLTMLAAPLLAFGVLSARTSIAFESAFAGVRKTVNATEAEFSALEAAIIDMATNPERLTSSLEGADVQLARIMELAGQMGISGVEDLSKFTETIALLGMTTDLSMDSASTELGRFANITGMSISDIDRLGATIVDLGNNFAGTESEIVEMMQRIAGAGNVIGLAPEEIAAFATALSSLGINPEAGGTAISRVMLEIFSAVGAGGDKLEAFAEIAGMSASAFADAFGSDPAQAMNSFLGGLRRIDEEGKNVALTLESLGLDDVRVRDTLLRVSTGTDVLTSALGLASEAWTENTALMEEARKRAATTESGINRLWNNLRNLQKTIGDQLKPKIDTLAESLIPVIQNVTAWVEANPELIGQIATAVVAVAGLGAGLFTAGHLITAVGGVVSAFGGLLGVLLSPIGLIIAAVAALAVLLGADLLGAFQGIGGGVGAFFGVIREGGSVFDGLRDGFGAFVSQILVSLGVPQEFAEQAGVAFAGFVDQLEAGFNGVVGFIQTTVLPGLGQLADWFLTTALPAVVDFISTRVFPVLEGLIGILGGIWAEVSPALGNLATWFIADVLPLMAQTIETVFMPAIQLVVDILGDIWAIVGPPLGELLDWFTASALPAITDFLSGTVVPLLRDFIGILSGIWEAVRPALESLFNWLRDRLAEIVDFIQSVIDKWNELKGGLGAYEGVAANANTIGQGLQSGQWGAGDVLGATWGAIRSEFGFAEGGDVPGGAPILVGEEGPEWFVPRQSGHVYPNGVMPSQAPALYPTGGDTYQITVMLPPDALRSPEVARRRGDDFGQALVERLRQMG